MSRTAHVVVPEVPYHIHQLLEMFGKWDNFLSGDLADEKVEEFQVMSEPDRLH